MDENSNSQSSSESVEVHAAVNHGGSPLMNGTIDDPYSDEGKINPFPNVKF